MGLKMKYVLIINDILNDDNILKVINLGIFDDWAFFGKLNYINTNYLASKLNYSYLKNKEIFKDTSEKLILLDLTFSLCICLNGNSSK